jgi:hypothetical protein
MVFKTLLTHGVIIQYDYRFNLLGKNRENHLSSIKKSDGLKYPQDKEFAYSHFIIQNKKLYFSVKPIFNKQVEGFDIYSSIFNQLADLGSIIDKGKKARLVNDFNAQLVVHPLLGLKL